MPFTTFYFLCVPFPPPAPLGRPPCPFLRSASVGAEQTSPGRLAPQGGLSRTTRRPDSCVSLRLRLHDTQPPYSISCHITYFRQRCKGRTPAQAGQVSGWKQCVPSACTSATPCFQIPLFPLLPLPLGRDASHHCPVPLLAARAAACLSGFASMTHSRRIPFPAIPHTLGNGAKDAPLPK